MRNRESVPYEEVERALLSLVAERVGCRPSDVDLNVPLARYGIGSLEAATIASKLETTTGAPVPERIFYECATLQQVVTALCASPAGPSSLVGALPAAAPGAGAGWMNNPPDSGRHARFHQVSVEQFHPPWATVDGRKRLLLNSYAYLGLSNHPRLIEAGKAALEAFGVGPHGSRVVSGTTTLHRQLERRLAAIHGKDDAIVYASGFDTNLGAISGLVGPDDVVVSDESNHASIIAGCRLSGAATYFFKHGDMDDLERCLRRAKDKRTLLVADAVFSMSGEILPLPMVTQLCRQYGALLMVDEAHSFGVLGKTGLGIAEHFGLEGACIDVKMGTLSKSLSSTGGYIAARQPLVDRLRTSSTTFIFSAAMAPAQAAIADAALQTLFNEPQRLQALRRNLLHFTAGLNKLGLGSFSSETPIVAIPCPDNDFCYQFAQNCWEMGLWVLPAVYPAVPLHAPRIRTTVTAAHSIADIDFALDVLRAVSKGM